jgi:DNA polymerase-1
MPHDRPLPTLARIFQMAGNMLIDKPPGYRTTHHPVHDSESGESLHINTEKDTWRCWSCEAWGGIVSAVMSLYRLDAKEAETWLQEQFPLSVARLAEDKALPESFLRQCGLGDIEPGVVGIPYYDQAGKVLHMKRRTAYTASLGSQWPHGVETMVYGLETLAIARERQYMVLIEGESDRWTLLHHGFPCLGIPGASNVKTLKAAYLEGIRTVYVWKETDAAGAGFVERVGKRLEALGWDGEAKVISAPKIKDPNVLHKRNPQEFKAKFQAILKAATLLQPRDVWKRIKTAPQFLAEPDPEFVGIAKDIVVPQAITVMVSPRGLCKTQTTLSLAVSLARGTTFRGEKLQPTRVLLLDRDNPTRYFKRSLRGWGGELADRLHVLGREDAPLLTNLGAWDELPAENYDVVIIDSMNSFLEGVTEKEGKALSEAMGALRTLAYRGPAVLLLGNTIKDGTVYKGRGEVADMVDILYEVRDATDFVPSLKRPWWEELPEAGDSAWATRAFRRKGRLDYRLAFISSKFRVGESPEPFCVEIRFPLDSPWTVEDVTEQLITSGEAAKAEAETAHKTTLMEAAKALLEIVVERSVTEYPLLKTEAEVYLQKEQELKRVDARAVIKDNANILWTIDTGKQGRGKGPAQILTPIQGASYTPDFGGRITELLEALPTNGYKGSYSAVQSQSERQNNDACSPCGTSSVETHFNLPKDTSVEGSIFSGGFSGSTNGLCEADEVVLANGTFHHLRIAFPPTVLNGLMPGHDPRLVWKSLPEPEPSQPSTEPLPSPSVEVGASYEGLSYTYITEPAQFERVLPHILEATTIGLDTETTGLNPRVDTLCLVQLATEDHTYIMNSRTVPPAMLAPIMAGDRWLIGQNLKFDLQMLVQAGLPWPSPSVRLLDTMLCAQVLDAGRQGDHSLEAMAETHLNMLLDKSLQVSDWSGVLSQDQLTYAARDAQVLLPLARVLREKLEEDRLWSTARLESACTAPLAWVELAGMPVDVEAWRALTEQLSQQAEALRHQLSALTGASPNWNSWQQVLPLLHDRGIPVQTTSRKVLIPYVQDDLVATWLKYKTVSKALSTYGEKWLTHVDPQTQRVYAEFHALGTDVGRMTCTKPNLQQIPRDLIFRRKFHASEGRCLIKADYSQLHLRIVAVVAPDQAMQEAYSHGADLHTVTAARFNHVTEEAVTKDQRQHAKVFNFGLLYAMGPARLQREAWEKYGVRLTETQANEQREQWFGLYPGIQRWHQKEDYALWHDHLTETRSLLGRRRTGIKYLPDRLSSQVLSIEADGAKQALVELFAHREDVPSAQVINIIHDEVLVECERSQAASVAAWMQQHMEAGMQIALKGKTSTPIEVSVGQSWAG